MTSKLPTGASLVRTNAAHEKHGYKPTALVNPNLMQELRGRTVTAASESPASSASSLSSSATVGTAKTALSSIANSTYSTISSGSSASKMPASTYAAFEIRPAPKKLNQKNLVL